MSLNQRISHRRLQARQRGDGDNIFNSFFGGDSSTGSPTPSDTETSSTSSPTSTSTTSKDNGGGGGHGGHQTPTPSSTTTTSTEIPTSTSSETSSKETTTSSSSSESTTSTSKTSSSTSETTTTSTSSTSKETTATTSTSNIVNKVVTAPSTTLVHTATSFAGSSIDAAPTQSSSAAPSTSGSLNTGAVVGGIAGGLVVVAIIGAIIAFYVRRMKNRRRADEFDAAQFRRSAMVMDGESRPNSFWGGAVRPISTFFHNSFRPGHNVAPSISSTQDAGLAGQGAWRSEQQQHQDYYTDEPQQQQQPEMVQANPAPQGTRGIQPRQQYTFGQAYEPEPAPTSAAAFVTPSSHVQEFDPFAGPNQYTGHAYSQTENVNYHHAHNGTQPTNDDAYGGM